MHREPVKGRGTGDNPQGRFERWGRAPADDGWARDDDDAESKPVTEVTKVEAKSIISRNDSPDVGFTQSINPYQGCEHGCIYCYARPSHAYWGLSPGLDFETKILAKINAATLLRAELAKPGYRCELISLGANTDPYQPIERELKITRSVLEVLAECNHPVGIVTKSSLVERDIDLLAPMAKKSLAMVCVSVTSLDDQLKRRLEPRAAAPQRRVQTIARLSEAGIPVCVLVAPVIPTMNDKDIEAVLEAAQAAGARSAGYVLLRLPYEVKGLFHDWLNQHYPQRAKHVISIIRQSRGERDNDPRFGSRMTGEGVFADLIRERFNKACRRLGLNQREVKLDTGQFKPSQQTSQLALF